MANLMYQMKSAIDSAFGENCNGGISKRSIKHDDHHQLQDHTYSYKERDRLIEVSSGFTKWIKEAHPEIKMVRDLTVDHAKEYLGSKHKFNGGTCNSNSVNTYEQSLDKIAHLCNKKFGCKIDMAVDHRELPQDGIKARGLRMEKSIFARALDTMRERGESKQCLKIARTTAMRASEFENLRAMDVDLKEMKLHIHDSKGGRDRDITLSSEAADILMKRIRDGGLSGHDKIFTIRAGTICKTLREGLKRVGHEEYAKAKTSVHAVRKMVAQEMYVARIRQYMDKEGKTFEKAEKAALGDVSEFLGHGRQRTIENYVDRYESLTDFEADGF